MANPLALFAGIERPILIRRAAMASAATWIIQLLTNVPLVQSEVAPLGSVSLQLARSLARAEQILEAWEAAGVTGWAVINLVLDFSLIASYATLLVALALWAGDRLVAKKWLGAGAIGITVAWAQWVAASSDVVENVAVLMLLSGMRFQALVSVALVGAITKLALVGVGLVWAALGGGLGLLRN